MKPERNRTRIIRLYKMEEALLTKSDGMSAVELADCFQVDRRTIYRDLSLMEELGIPLHKVYGEGSRFKILGTYKVPSYRPNIAVEV